MAYLNEIACIRHLDIRWWITSGMVTYQSQSITRLCYLLPITRLYLEAKFVVSTQALDFNAMQGRLYLIIEYFSY